MTEYKVKSAIKHDGETFEKGSTISLSPADAKPLLADGIIVNSSEEINDEEPVTPQPPVNVVKRADDQGGTKGAGTIEAERVVEPGKVEQPQPGDNDDDETGAETTDDQGGTKGEEAEGDEADKL